MKRLYAEGKLKPKKGMLGKHHTKKWKQEAQERNADRVHIYSPNLDEEKFIHRRELNSYLTKGYRLGRRDMSEITREKHRQRALKETGEKGRNAKLTWKQVREIRQKYVPHVYHANMLAKEYNISNSVIYNIIKNEIWCES